MRPGDYGPLQVKQGGPAHHPQCPVYQQHNVHLPVYHH